MIHDLLIARRSLTVFREEVGFLQKEKQEKLAEYLGSYTRGPYAEPFTARVLSVMPDGEEDVFDLTQPDTCSFVANGIVVHNCAEEALHANNSCNLGSIDLASSTRPRCVLTGGGSRRRRAGACASSTTWVDTCAWPLEEIHDVVKRTRPVGLGVMGFADLLLLNEITYGSDESIELIGEVMSFVRRESGPELAGSARRKAASPSTTRTAPPTTASCAK